MAVSTSKALASGARQEIDYNVNSLRGRANPLPESDSTSEEYGAAVGGRHETSEPKRTTEQKVRKCLICRSPFLSAWAGERICGRCKDTAAWRSGAFK